MIVELNHMTRRTTTATAAAIAVEGVGGVERAIGQGARHAEGEIEERGGDESVREVLGEGLDGARGGLAGVEIGGRRAPQVKAEARARRHEITGREGRRHA